MRQTAASKQFSNLARTHSLSPSPGLSLASKKAQLQEVTELTTRLSTFLSQSHRKEPGSKIYPRSSGNPKKSLHCLASNSSSGLGLAILFPSPFTTPDSPFESTFWPDKTSQAVWAFCRSPKSNHLWDSLVWPSSTGPHSGFHLPTRLKSSINLAAMYGKGMKSLFRCHLLH